MKLSNISKIVAVIIIQSLIFNGCTKEEEKTTNNRPIVKVKVNTIKTSTYPIWINLTGKTQAFKKVEIVPRISGELVKLHFKAGAKVKKGQLLFTIDDTKYKTILSQKTANLSKDIASLNLANANVKRYKPLVKEQLAPLEKLDQLIATKKQIEATIKEDKATIEEAKLNIEYCTIKATIDGDISKSFIGVGNIVNQSSKLANIVQSDKLYINFSQSSDTVSLLKKYLSTKKPAVKIYAGDKKNSLEFNGKLDYIDNVTDEATGTVAMRAIINNEDNILFPGAFVNIKLFVSDKIPVIALKPNNISQNQLGSYVLVVDKNNKIATRQVTVEYTNDDLSIIENGLVEGDLVVVGNISKLRDNQVVKPIEVKNEIKK